MGEPFTAFLCASLALVRRDAPFCADAIAATLGATCVVLEVGQERCVIIADPDLRAASAPAANVEPAPDRAIVLTTAKALLDLVDGAAVIDLVLRNRLRVRVTPDRAACVFDALRLYVEGCARSPDVDPLLAAFRAEIEPPARGVMS